ncbi:MAG: formate dehydrogenase accessory sulfurtransferase FdhD [Desulfobacterales bacterium]
MDNYLNHRTIKWRDGKHSFENQELICEEPLSIRIQGKAYSVVMRTPGDEFAHAAGFCLAEGIVDQSEDIVSLGFCDGEDTNVITVTLTPSRQKIIGRHLDRRQYISQTSCGICGKQLVDELRQLLRPVEKNMQMNASRGLACLDKLSEYQPLRARTRAAHAAALFDKDYNLISIAEDVGRHNALDKAVGKLFLDKTLNQAAFLVLSSRISYELVQKAARARIAAIFAISRPTALAVSLASSLNMTLVSRGKNNGLFVYCGETRLINSPV